MGQFEAREKPMRRFEEQARAFAAGKLEATAHARQLAVASLICGIDLPDALEAPPERKAILSRRIARMIERERLKGMRRHWNYDLNRHIALKQLLDRLAPIGASPAVSGAAKKQTTPLGRRRFRK